MPITRRQFIGAGVAVAAVTGVAATGVGRVLHGLGPSDAAASTPDAEPKETITRSAPNPECSTCAMLVSARNGKVVRISPDPNFPIKPCARGYSRVQSIYHPDRLKYPMKRVGARGEGKWERISWNQALDEIAQKLAQIRDTTGPETVMFMGGAVHSYMPGGSRGRFANAYGKGVTTGTIGNMCCGAQAEAFQAMLGRRVSSIETLGDAKLLIEWGHNSIVTYTPWWRYKADAIDKGAKLVVIDPRFSETASKADLWIAPKAGTDTVLALGMAKVIIDEKLYDEPFILKKTNLPFLVNQANGKLLLETDILPSGNPKAYLVWDTATNSAVKPDAAKAPALTGDFTVGTIKARTVFDDLKALVAKYTPEKVEQMTGVKANNAVALARLYASTKPAMIDPAMGGVQRTSNGVHFIGSLINLASLTGNWGIPGAGVHDCGGESSTAGAEKSPPSPYKSVTKGSVRAACMGKDLLANKPYPIKAFYWGGGSVGQKNNSELFKEALLKMDFMVTQDHFMTDAASISDYVLPAAHLFEQVDLLGPKRNFYYQILDKAAEPLFEAKSDWWIYTELAKRLGFGEFFTMSEEEYCNLYIEPMGFTMDTLRKNGPVWLWSKPEYNIFKVKWDKPPFYWFKDTPFLTPSGRIELHSAKWEGLKLPTMPDYTYPNDESPETKPDLAKKYPLALVTAKIRTKVHATYGIMPWMLEIHPEAWVDIHEKDAAARGIKDGDTVQVLNDRGMIKVKARVHVGMLPGVVSLQNGWWMQQGGNGSVVTNDAPEPIGSHNSLNSTLVEVRRA